MWSRLYEPLLTCEAVLLESIFLLQSGGILLYLTLHCLELFERGLVRIDFSISSLSAGRLVNLLRKYADQPMSLAAACLVRMAELRDNCQIFTTDRDFLVYRRKGLQRHSIARAVFNSNNFHRTFRQRVEKGLAVLLRQHAIIQHHDDAGVGFGANQPANALAEFQNRLRQGKVAEGIPPRASIASIRASMSGWSGTANGSRVMMTLLKASPGTSTPCQKLSVPNSTESTSSLNFSSIVERACPCPAPGTRRQAG